MALGLAFAFTGCGGSGNKTTVFEPVNPLYSGIFFAVTAPAAIAPVVASAFGRLGQSGGTIVVDKPQGPRVCSQQGKLTLLTLSANATSAEAERLRKYVGDAMSIAVYGTNAQIPLLCKLIEARAH